MKYPIGIQNFESLRKDHYLYIDKTALIHQMVENGRYYFLSRPRRFGKSLLVSTLEAYFLGKKELFEGLALEGLEQKWEKRPVLHLDLNIERYESLDNLTDILNVNLKLWGTDLRQRRVGNVRLSPFCRHHPPGIRKRQATGWQSWWMNTTSLCFNQLATKSCRNNSATP